MCRDRVSFLSVGLLLGVLACQGAAADPESSRSPPPSPAATGGASAPAAGGSATPPAPPATGGGPGTGGAPSTGGAPGTGGSPNTGGAPASDAAAPSETPSAPDATPSGPSAGCGKSSPGGMVTITAGDASTPARILLPTNYEPAKPYPLVIYLHGRGNGLEGQGNLAREIAGANLGIVANLKSFGGSGWEVPNRDRPVENLALVRALIKHTSDQHCVDSKKIIVSGFSSGCWFASRLACLMKDEIAGVVAAACGLDPMGRCPDKKPITYIIGRGDGAFGGAPAAADFYRTRNGCQMTSKPTATAPCALYDGCAAGAPATYCAHPGGHQWPGFGAKAVLEMLEKL